MAQWKWLAGAGIALTATLTFAQDAPRSLLPPGFDDPAPAPAQRPAPAQPAPGAAPAPGTPVVQPLPGQLPAMPDLSGVDLSSIPSIEQLEAMSPEELDELLGLRSNYDIPPAARRAMTRVGVISAEENGLPSRSLARQPAGLVKAVLEGLDGPVVSRWGHILLRRALASRLATPEGMDPAEFAGLRARALNRMGEYGIARALVQDVDANNWNDGLLNAGLEAYLATTDVIGTCPVVRLRGPDRDDVQWQMLRAICNSYAGEGVLGGSQLDRLLRTEAAPAIDVLLAQRLAGAAGRGRRAVDVEWDEVEELSPWRFALANAVGEEIPENLREQVTPYYERIWAFTPSVPLSLRAQGADRAAREGIFSSRAMVDLYGQIFAMEGMTGDPTDVATQLREAYVGSDPQARLGAMRAIWGGDTAGDYGRYVLTAYAAARMPASADYADAAPALLASMLTAGLDRDANAWASVVEPGSDGWALVALARAGGARPVPRDAVDAFIDDDGSSDYRRSKLLLAGLAGLGRIAPDDLGDFAGRVELDLNRETRWSRTISRAAAVENRALVALLAGLGMQGEGWQRMTPRHLYHIVSALRRVGLEAEARMIAAEAIARG
ncbi:hypothetical protein G6N82_02270 [Altererythrobacter sp. BO-6]|uniref:hypothetical protein n=1 Tax=Altererythrobacter sp. BO-6 TaxID=2604537 RepID=UPI0013E1137A|nr:hypothetical protein [Altererythrobacter sp. BO-6]QIG53133.1 hypothetical protein G6N82_02270 [Altererythrobacter sp. BO-6]